jgi:hypothetical protein
MADTLTKLDAKDILGMADNGTNPKSGQKIVDPIKAFGEDGKRKDIVNIPDTPAATPPADPPANVAPTPDSSAAASNVVVKIKGEPSAQGSDKPDISDILKEKTSGKYNSLDEIIEALNKAPQVKAPDFANDFSRTIYDYLLEGKVDEVVDKLAVQSKLAKVRDMSDEQVIKEQLRYQNPTWDESDIADEYDQWFEGLNSSEEAEKRKARRTQKQKAQEARTYLGTLSQELKLPALSHQQPNNQEDMAAIKNYRDKYVVGLQSAKTEFDGYTTKLNDDDIELETKFVIPAEDKENFVRSMETFNLVQFFDKNYFSGENYNVKELLSDMWLLQRDDKGVKNYEKVIAAQIKQTYNAAKKEWAARFKGKTPDDSSSQPVVVNTKEKQSKEILTTVI